MNDLICDHGGKLLLAFLALIVGAVVFAANHDMEVAAAFMAECQKDRKEYECVAMWRAGNSDVVPVYIHGN